MMQSTADLLDRLRQFVQAEAETQYENLNRQWARPIGERVANGWEIEGSLIKGDPIGGSLVPNGKQN